MTLGLEENNRVSLSDLKVYLINIYLSSVVVDSTLHFSSKTRESTHKDFEQKWKRNSKNDEYISVPIKLI